MKVKILQPFSTPGLPEFLPGEFAEVDEETGRIFIDRGLVEKAETKPADKPEVEASETEEKP